MGKKRKKTRNRSGFQGFTLCISTALVLILLGMVVFSVLTSRNLSNYFKENMVVTMMLDAETTNSEALQLCRSIAKKPYIAHLDYISKEQTLREQSKALGSNPVEFVGHNPFLSSIEVRPKADYANSDSLIWIKADLKKMARVGEITYQKNLMDSVNKNLRKINIVLLILATLLIFVSFSLINNTVRLGVYAQRFSIHTMKLVGASWGFIKRPFLKRAIGVGLLAALLANLVLCGGAWALYNYEPGVFRIMTWDVWAITAGAVVLLGVLITLVCSNIAVNKFLRMSAGELYKI